MQIPNYHASGETKFKLLSTLDFETENPKFLDTSNLADMDVE